MVVTRIYDFGEKGKSPPLLRKDSERVSSRGMGTFARPGGTLFFLPDEESPRVGKKAAKDVGIGKGGLPAGRTTSQNGGGGSTNHVVMPRGPGHPPSGVRKARNRGIKKKTQKKRGTWKTGPNSEGQGSTGGGRRKETTKTIIDFWEPEGGKMLTFNGKTGLCGGKRGGALGPGLLPDRLKTGEKTPQNSLLTKKKKKRKKKKEKRKKEKKKKKKKEERKRKRTRANNLTSGTRGEK